VSLKAALGNTGGLYWHFHCSGIREYNANETLMLSTQLHLCRGFRAHTNYLAIAPHPIGH
jgi:hypothetical protein